MQVIDELVLYLAGSVNWLASVLPADPFSGYATAGETLAVGLGWLNWLFPVHDAAIAFGAFVAALAAKRVGSAVYSIGKGAVGLLTGVS